MVASLSSSPDEVIRTLEAALDPQKCKEFCKRFLEVSNKLVEGNLFEAFLKDDSFAADSRQNFVNQYFIIFQEPSLKQISLHTFLNKLAEANVHGQHKEELELFADIVINVEGHENCTACRTLCHKAFHEPEDGSSVMSSQTNRQICVDLPEHNGNIDTLV